MVPNIYALQFYRYLGAPDGFFDHTGLVLADLEKLGGEIRFDQYCQILVNARRCSGDDAIALRLGAALGPTLTHGPVSVAVLSSPTLRHALQLAYRFGFLRLQASHYRWVDEPGHVGVAIRIDPAGEARTMVVEFLLLSLTGVMMRIQSQAPDVQIEVDYQKPLYAGEYQQAFAGAEVSFGRPEIRLLVPDPAGDLALGESDPGTYAAAVAQCERLLRETRHPGSLTARIRRLLAENPGRLWSIDEVAAGLNLSTRTLQRRLHGEGVTYKTLLEEWLYSESKRLLSGPLTIEAVGIMLGYSDVANFRAAFRRWSGVPPGSWRDSRAQPAENPRG